MWKAEGFPGKKVSMAKKKRRQSSLHDCDRFSCFAIDWQLVISNSCLCSGMPRYGCIWRNMFIVHLYGRCLVRQHVMLGKKLCVSCSFSLAAAKEPFAGFILATLWFHKHKHFLRVFWSWNSKRLFDIALHCSKKLRRSKLNHSYQKSLAEKYTWQV